MAHPEPVIIYCSQTGFTKRYADWLAEEYGCQATPFKKRKNVDIANADVVIYCSWFHAGGIKGAKWIQGIMSEYPEKQFVVIGCGAYPMPCEKWPKSDIDEAFEKSLSCSQHANVKCFYCQGGFDFDRLGAPDKVAMRMFFKMLEKKRDEDLRNAEVLETMRDGFDGTNREYLTSAISYINLLLAK